MLDGAHEIREKQKDEASKMVPNFQPKEVADVLDLLLHMVCVIAEEGQPSLDDIEHVRQMIEKIRISR